LRSRRGGATRRARGRATFDAPAGDREISGCARGLFWLQKSTSGAGSTPSGMGLAPTPHAREGNLPARFCLVQRGFCFAQRGEEASWPARVTSSATVTPRGPWESRRVHATTNLRVRTAAMPCGRVGTPVMRGSGDARATAPVNLGVAEGAVVDGRRPGAASSAAFDEAAGEPDLPARRMLSSVPSHEGAVAAPAGRTRGVRGHVTSSVRGRKSRDREVSRGGAVDRSSARTAWCPLRRERPGSRLRARAGNGS